VPTPRKATPLKRCANCGTKMERRVNASGRLEDMGVFMRRIYCCRACMAKAMMHEDASRVAHQARARRYRGAQCADCGATEHLHAHHADSDWSNTTAENIITLCASCHLRRHWREGKTHGKRRSA